LSRQEEIMVPNKRSGARRHLLARFAPALLLAACATAGEAQPQSAVPAAPAATFADVASLVEAASVVAQVVVRDQAVVEPERAPGLAPGHARLYVEGATEAVLAARSGLGEALVFLADVPLRADGKAPRMAKQRLLLFAVPVEGRPGTLQLVSPDAFLVATPETEQLVRSVIAALAVPDAPPPITGIRDVMSVAGNLAGESETQLFLDTVTGSPVSLTVIRRPGMEPQWGVSWSEIVDQAARPPEPGSAAWYRLACFLPAQLPQDAFLQQEQAARAQAQADYRLIVEQLGECRRTRT
jgi:hypothetical protein